MFLQQARCAQFLEITMFFTVAVDLPEGNFFEYSTESFLQFLQAVAAFSDGEVVEVEDDGVAIPDDLDYLFAEDEEYVYDEDAECFCWYDEEYDAWYWLNEESGEWLLVEDEAKDEAEDEEEAEEA
jgi:hypothetical protein